MNLEAYLLKIFENKIQIIEHLRNTQYTKESTSLITSSISCLNYILQFYEQDLLTFIFSDFAGNFIFMNVRATTNTRQKGDSFPVSFKNRQMCIDGT